MVMTSRVWIVTWLPLVFAAVSELPTPTQLTLTSRNLQHLLTWEPGPGTPPGTVYTVTKRTNWDPEAEAVPGCKHVLKPLTCNLTEALEKHLFDSYSIQVKAVMGNQFSPAAEVARFRPVEHLDLPLLTLKSCSRNLCIELRPPHGYLSSTYNQIQYELQIRDSNKPAELILKEFSMEGGVLEHLSSGRQYCVSVRFADKLQKIFSNFSQPVCAYTASIFSAEPVISSLVCLLLAVLAVLVGLFLWTRLLCLDFSKLPTVLTTIPHMKEVLVQSHPESVSSLSNILPKALKAPTLSSSEDSEDDDEEEESITESSGASSQEGYKDPGASSSLPSSSRIRLQPTFCPDPPYQKKAQVIADPLSRTEPSGSPAGTGTDEKKLLEGEAGAQEVNLFTVTFSWELEEEQQEDPLLSLCFSGPSEEGTGPEDDLAGGVTAALAAASQPPQQEVVEEEDDDSSGYMCHPPAQSV